MVILSAMYFCFHVLLMSALWCCCWYA